MRDGLNSMKRRRRARTRRGTEGVGMVRCRTWGIERGGDSESRGGREKGRGRGVWSIGVRAYAFRSIVALSLPCPLKLQSIKGLLIIIWRCVI